MKKLLLGIIFSLWTSLACANVPCTVPFNLQNNTTADATQVMANYNAILTCLTNAAAAGANNDITALLGLITPIGPALGGSQLFTGGTSGGSANAQTIGGLTPTGFTLAAGKCVLFTAGFTNTGFTQFNVNATGLTNAFRQTPIGPVALLGGEIIAGNQVLACYDGVQFEVLSTHNQVGGYGPLATLASAATTDLGGTGSHNINVTGNVTITSFGPTCSGVYPFYSVFFSGAPLITQGVNLITPGGGNIQATAGDHAIALCVASNQWRILDYTKSNGTAIVNPTPLCGAIGLRIFNNAVTPNTQIDVAYDSAVMINPTGNVPIYTTNGSFTVDLTQGTVTSAANGMDGEARGTSAWIDLFLISNGTVSAGLGSLAAGNALTPTMPAGYIYRCYAGAMRVDGAGNLLRTRQLGNSTQYVVVTATNTAAMPQLSAGNTGSLAVPTWTSTPTGAFVPPTATSIITVLGLIGNTNGALMVAPNNNYGASASTTNPPPCQLNIAATAYAANVSMQCKLLLESANVFVASNSTGAVLWAFGWNDKVNAN